MALNINQSITWWVLGSQYALARQIFVPVPNRGLDCKRHMLWSFCIQGDKMRGDCSCCWYWWNYWPSLFHFLFIIKKNDWATAKPTIDWGCSQVIQKCRQFLLHWCYSSCYACSNSFVPVPVKGHFCIFFPCIFVFVLVQNTCIAEIMLALH
jgi:hypothetical protein